MVTMWVIGVVNLLTTWTFQANARYQDLEAKKNQESLINNLEFQA